MMLKRAHRLSKTFNKAYLTLSQITPIQESGREKVFLNEKFFSHHSWLLLFNSLHFEQKQKININPKWETQTTTKYDVTGNLPDF